MDNSILDNDSPPFPSDGTEINIHQYIDSVEIHYEHTVATAQFENLKPKVVIKLNDSSDELIQETLRKCRGYMRKEHQAINKKIDKARS